MSREPKEPSPQPGERRRPTEAFLPSDGTHLLGPSLQVGAGAGIMGMFVGAVVGIARSTPVAFSAAFAGAQWFTLGASYYASRRLVISTLWADPEYELGPSETIKASGIAGGCAGLFGGLLRGPRTAIPSMFLFSVLGAGGQAALNAAVGTGSPTRQSSGWLDSRWSPVTRLSDREYSGLLQDKIMRLDVEIAIADEAISALRESKRKSSTEAGDSHAEQSN